MWKMEKYYKILELDKIIQKIQELCQLEETKTNLKNLKLLNDLDKINDTLAEVDEATILIQRMQRFPLYFKSDLRKTLNLINKGYVINLDELLVIAKFLDTIKANQVYLDTIENLKIETKYFKKNVDKLFYPKELNLRIKDIITPYGEINDHATVELAKIRKAIGEAVKAKVDLILTSGGTGFSGRDVTPEATKQEIEKEAPGIAEAIRAHSMAITKRAMLSRGIAGISGNSLIINLPGSPKAVAESIDAFVDQLEHAFKMMAGGGH